jgi:carbon storage regulator
MMLVLTRKEHEEIVIGDDIVISVVRIKVDRVQLGVAAPKGTRVDRREVRERILGQEDRDAKAGSE